MFLLPTPLAVNNRALLLMKIHPYTLALIVWICACCGTVSAQKGSASPLPQPLPALSTLPTLPAVLPPLPPPALPATLPAQSATPAPNYNGVLNDRIKLEKGDRLSYRIAEERGNPVILIINDAGDVDVPLVGQVRAMNKTCKELAQEIKPLLEKEFYYKATVIIGLETHSERALGKFYAMGEVRIPGGVDIPAGELLTVSKAVARAQGFTEYADKSSVRLIRKNEQGKNEMSIIDVGEIIDKGLIDKDPAVLPNDIVIVPTIKRFRSKVYVLGRVRIPCGLELQANEQITVTKAIATAQGFADYADREKVKLLRKNVIVPWFAVEDMQNPFSLANKIVASPDPLSQHLKTLLTPQSLDILKDPKATVQQQKFVLIEELNNAIRGVLLYEEKRFDGVKLSPEALRLKAQNPKGEDLIRLNRMLLEDFYPKELRRNRVPEYQTFVVNVADVLDRGLVDKDIPLEPNDLVLVTESKRTFSKVSIMGQVHYPQTIEMLSGGNLTVSQVIAKAGGFSEFANKSKVKLLRKNGGDSYLFTNDDIANLRRMAKKLREHQDPLSRFLWEHLTYPARQVLSDPNSPPEQQRIAIVKELNRLIKNGSIYTEARFAGQKLPADLMLAIASQSGTFLLTTDDFIDLSSMLVKLNAHADPLNQYLWSQFPEQEKKVITNASSATSRQQESTVVEALITGLNNVLRGGSIFSPPRFENVEISSEALALLTQNPQGEELVRLNRLLLEDACPQEIKRNQYNPNSKAVTRFNRRLLEAAYPKEIKRHEEYDTIMVNMERIIDRAELDKDPLIEPDDLIVVPERWINF